MALERRELNTRTKRDRLKNLLPRTEEVTKQKLLNAFKELCPHLSDKQLITMYKVAYPSGEVWPTKNKWWHNKVWLNEIKDKYPKMEKVLVVLHKNRLIYWEAKEVGEKYFTNEDDNENRYTYAYVGTDYHYMAKEISCSRDTLRKYVSALVKLGALRRISLGGQHGQRIAIGYWTSWRDDESGKDGKKVVYFLGSKNAGILKGFTPFGA